MTEAYDGRQVVGIDLHRRRSVIVRMTEDGGKLETVRITNSPAALRAVIAKAGKNPRVVIEATYGWYWAVDVLEARGRRCTWRIRWGSRPSPTAGSRTMSGTPRTWPTCCGWAGVPEGWIAPQEIRELRELTRYRHKLVGRAPRAGTRCTRCWPSSASRSPIRTSSACTGRRGWTSWSSPSRTRARSPRCGS